MNRIRPIVLCVIRRGNHILVEHGFDPVKGKHFFRPPGGGIEFGERAVEAVRREIREELNAELASPRLLGVVENLFRYKGEPGHEIAFVFEAEFEDPTFYDREEFAFDDAGDRIQASWKSLAEFGPGVPLYPDDLRVMLATSAGRV